MEKIPVFKTEEGRQKICKEYEKVLTVWPVPLERMLIETEYGKTFVLAFGEKESPPVILLHGASANSAFWAGDAPLLAKKFRVYAVDIAGEPGYSGEYQLPRKEELYVSWLSEVFSRLNLQKAAIVGVSLGGWIGLCFTAKHPKKVAALTLIGSAGVGEVKKLFFLRVLPLLFLGNKGISKIAKIVNGGVEVDPLAVEYQKLLAKYSNQQMSNIPVLSDDKLMNIVPPVQFFAGAKDALLHSKKGAARIKKLLPQARVTLFPDKGHVLIGFTQEIADFILESVCQK